MRRMRDNWQYLLFAIPGVAAALGIQYLVRKHYPEPANPELAMMKPSAFKTDSAGKNAGKSASADEDEVDSGAIAQGDAGKEEGDGFAGADGAKDNKDHSLKGIKVAKESEEEDDLEADVVETAEQRKVASEERAKDKAEGRLEKNLSPSKDPVIANAGKDAKNGCTSVEYRGDGPQNTKITKAEWARVITQFHDVKSELTDWLEKHRKEFPDKTAKLLDEQIKKVKIQRPPTMEEPDLAWRGIGVYTINAQNEAVIRIGGGFVKLAVKQPQRAKFELARLVAQSWAPCELQRSSSAEAWGPLLSCLGVQEEGACGNGTYSEGGWAISTAVASIVAHPGCNVPAFNAPEVAKCLKKVPLPLTISQSSDRVPSSAAAPSREETK